MTAFEQEWYAKYIRNMVSIATLQLLVNAGKLKQKTVDGWVKERVEKHGT